MSAMRSIQRALPGQKQPDFRPSTPTSGPALLRPRLDDPGHDPAVLADLAVPDEPELLIGRQRAVEQEPGGHPTRLLRLRLDAPPAHPRDELTRPGEPRAGTARAPVPLPGKEARDAPVGRARPGFLVRRPVLDPGHPAGCADLPPPHAIVPAEDECGV